MDRGEGQKDNLASLQGLEGVAAGASTRVGEILAEAERLAREAHTEADRAAAETRRDAEREVERIAAEAREAARAAARERARELAALQAALTARGPAVVEGLEGAGLTRARLEAVVGALAAAADELMVEADEGDPRAGAAEAPEREAAPDREPEPEPAPEADASPEPEPEPAPEAGASPEPEPEPSASPEADEPAEAEADPVAAAEDLAKPIMEAEPAGSPSDDGNADGNGNGNGSLVSPYEGPLPEGAPLARKPKRSRERDARFAALLLAVQGRPRDEVDAHLRSEYGFDDVEPILDEVFGRATA